MSFETALIVHTVSFLILGVFFEVPELSLNLWCLLSVKGTNTRREIDIYKKIFALRYVLTHFIAPTAGIAVITSGLYLVYLSKNDSLANAWLFWLMCTATIGLYKGLIQHNTYIRKIIRLLDSDKAEGELQYYLRSPFDHIAIFTECPTYVFNYWLACAKPSWLPSPFSGIIIDLDRYFNSRAAAGLFIVGLGGLLIFVLRFLMKQYSRVYSL